MITRSDLITQLPCLIHMDINWRTTKNLSLRGILLLFHQLLHCRYPIQIQIRLRALSERNLDGTIDRHHHRHNLHRCITWNYISVHII